MSASALKTAVGGAPPPTTEKPSSPVVMFSRVLDSFKPQLALALPKHLNSDRMARLALTAFSRTPNLQKSEPRSILASLMTAAQLGLEPEVNGQGYLIPYWDNKRSVYVCQFIPGWKGLQDLVNRSGRATSWTGAVFKGDEFDYAMGDRPFIKHRPGDNTDEKDLLYVYSVGRVNGADWPIIDVWPMTKVWKHLTKNNRQGDKHYGFRNPEMYGRKLPLLQVLKYLPSSVELSNAIALTNHIESGGLAHIDMEGLVHVMDDDTPDPETGEVPPPPPPPPAGAKGGKGKGGAAAAAPAPSPDAAVAEKAAADGAAGNAPPEYTIEQYVQQVNAAKDRDEGATAVDLARSEHGEASKPVLEAFRAKFNAAG